MWNKDGTYARVNVYMPLICILALYVLLELLVFNTEYIKVLQFRTLTLAYWNICLQLT